IALQRPTGIHQDVLASFDRALIDRSGNDWILGSTSPVANRAISADARDRIVWIVVVAIRLLAARRLQVQAAVAARRVSAPITMEEVGSEGGPGERPLPLGAPDVRPHHEDLDRRRIEEAGVVALEPVVEPA